MNKLLFALIISTVSACATGGRNAAAPSTAVDLATPHCYDSAQVERIAEMRDAGDSLADVAAAVGGTRADVRRVEQDLRARKHGRAGGDSGCAMVAVAVSCETPPCR